MYLALIALISKHLGENSMFPNFLAKNEFSDALHKRNQEKVSGNELPLG